MKMLKRKNRSISQIICDFLTYVKKNLLGPKI